MQAGPSERLYYQRSRFVTRLPVNYRYTSEHTWLAAQDNGRWRVGLTRLATRMLGEMVDHAFDVAPGTGVTPGEVLGWLEGFKAISDVLCAGSGQFTGGNPALKSKVALVSDDPYATGWLYEFTGEPQAGCMNVQEYCTVLDAAIDRFLAKNQNEENQ